MRTLPSHFADPITITAGDPVGPGGSSRYQLTGFNLSENPAVLAEDFCHPMDSLLIVFQNGHPAQVGTNGVTMESLTQVLIDRLEGFQSGPYACALNAEALEHYKAALRCMTERQAQRTELVTMKLPG
jgi:hypothetical protein